MTNNKTGLHVVITNAFIENWSGSELYVRDLATELIKRGHTPIIYSPRLGKLAEELRAKSIPVVKDLNSIGAEPDLIHGQHHLETMTALSHFPSTPAVFFCHGWTPWEETPPFHPRIIQYVTVSDALHDRLVYECGIPTEKITTILNFVDLERFRPRSPLPVRPKRALVFSNQVSETNSLGVVREACTLSGIVVDVIGYGSGNPSFNPEAQLGNYDIIFARGRAALEGLAIGAAVICCDQEGVSQMVTMQNLEWLRRNNFGIRVLNRPITAEFLSAEIQRYDPADAIKVSQKVRATAGLTEAVDQILGVYNTSLDGWAKNYPHDLAGESLAVSTYLKGISEAFYQASIDRNMAIARASDLQGELDDLRSRLTWRLYERVIHIGFVRNSYFRLITTFRRWRARRKEKKASIS
jgi:hypothetical protein